MNDPAFEPFDRFRFVDPESLFTAGPYTVLLVMVADDAPLEFLRGTHYKTTYYGVYNEETGVLEYETPVFAEARFIAASSSKVAAEDAPDPEWAKLLEPEDKPN